MLNFCVVILFRFLYFPQIKKISVLLIKKMSHDDFYSFLVF